ncbi:MAG: hypothetical protein M3Z24_08790 [Chloroflexota bacterium]|nr:hypothetical protein [Chloroflexota bacterium]
MLVGQDMTNGPSRVDQNSESIGSSSSPNSAIVHLSDAVETVRLPDMLDFLGLKGTRHRQPELPMLRAIRSDCHNHLEHLMKLTA